MAVQVEDPYRGRSSKHSEARFMCGKFHRLGPTEVSSPQPIPGLAWEAIPCIGTRSPLRKIWPRTSRPRTSRPNLFYGIFGTCLSVTHYLAHEPGVASWDLDLLEPSEWESLALDLLHESRVPNVTKTVLLLARGSDIEVGAF